MHGLTQLMPAHLLQLFNDIAQCFGSGSALDPHSMGSWFWIWIRGKSAPKKKKN
jgi:hypothetical protein